MGKKSIDSMWLIAENKIHYLLNGSQYKQYNVYYINVLHFITRNLCQALRNVTKNTIVKLRCTQVLRVFVV